jgi:hypothetical protein
MTVIVATNVCPDRLNDWFYECSVPELLACVESIIPKIQLLLAFAHNNEEAINHDVHLVSGDINKMDSLAVVMRLVLAQIQLSDDCS